MNIFYRILILGTFVSNPVWGQFSKIIVDSKTNLHLNISVSHNSISLSNPNRREVKLVLTILNKCDNDIQIYDPLESTGGFNETDELPVNDAYLSFKVEKYDEMKSSWRTLENNIIFNDLDYVGFLDENNVVVKNISPGRAYVTDIPLFERFNLKAGEYRITTYLGMKLEQNSFMIVNSNMVIFDIKP